MTSPTRRRAGLAIVTVGIALGAAGPLSPPAGAEESTVVRGPRCATGGADFPAGTVSIGTWNITGQTPSAKIKGWTWQNRRAGVRDTLAGCTADVYALQEAAPSRVEPLSTQNYPDTTSQFEQVITDLNDALAKDPSVRDRYALANAKRDQCRDENNPPGGRDAVPDTNCQYGPASAHPNDNRIIYNTARVAAVPTSTGAPWQFSYDLPMLKGGNRRTLHAAQFTDLASGKRFIVATTHLEAGSSNYSLRMRQIDAVRTKLRAVYTQLKVPIVLTGDLNSNRSELKENPSDRLRYDTTLKMIDILGQDRRTYKTGSGKTYRGKCDVPTSMRSAYFVPYTKAARQYAFYDSSTASDRRNDCPKSGWQYNGYVIDYIFTTREFRPQAWHTVVAPSRPYSRTNAYTKLSPGYPSDHPLHSDHNLLVSKLRLP